MLLEPAAPPPLFSSSLGALFAPCSFVWVTHDSIFCIHMACKVNRINDDDGGYRSFGIQHSCWASASHYFKGTYAFIFFGQGLLNPLHSSIFQETWILTNTGIRIPVLMMMTLTLWKNSTVAIAFGGMQFPCLMLHVSSLISGRDIW